MADALPPVPTPTGLGASASAGISDPIAARNRYSAADWRLLWADEFDVPGRPDPARWGYESGLVRNKEAQFYTVDRAENSCVRDGSLVITAIREPWEGAAYTSASLTSRDRFAFTYGKVEIRARLPDGRGLWPALWTLGQRQEGVRWPAIGEIDLMEYVGMHPDQVHFTVHTAAFNHVIGTQRGTRITVPRPWEAFHTYGLVWTPQALEWFFDGQPVFSFANDGAGSEHWPFDRPQYLIMNLAVGGAWGGQQGIDDSVFPAEFRVDYVRVWQK
ncbi:MAG TPA: glycoside hydrolase [Planctomycetes bacterium]|nr:glycoside hydrolase [Planctomycetota bacterium]